MASMQEKQFHVLVVDDDWMNREVVEANLLTENYRVTTAHNGQKALELATSDPPDLVLLDMMLPDINGLEVCARIKEDDNLRFIPVVFVTALEKDEDKLKAIQAGADDFISKPFDSLMMLTRVKSLLRMKGLHDELEYKNKLLQRIMNRYVGEEIAAVILIDPERYLQLGGETRHISILFADISGFTAFAEDHSAQEVIQVLNRFFGELTPLIFKHHGTFDKYIGDEIMAFFGAPVSTGDDTLNAVQAAVDMQQHFWRVRDELGYSDLTLEIGIHSGDAAVGNVGSQQVMNYTVIGDVVNTAHRLQEAANDNQILISADTYHEVKERVEATPLPPLQLPGKRQPFNAYVLKRLK